MRFDLTAEVAAFERRRDRRESEQAVRALTDHRIEAWLLVAVLCNYKLETCADERGCECRADLEAEPDPRVRLRTVDVEADDFAHPLHRLAFSAYRNLEAGDREIGPLDWTFEVAEEVARLDKDRGTFAGERLNHTWFADLLRAHPRRLHRCELRRFVRRLRDLAQLRRLA